MIGSLLWKQNTGSTRYLTLSLPGHLPPFGLVPVPGLIAWGASSGFAFWMIGVAGNSSFDLRSMFDPTGCAR